MSATPDTLQSVPVENILVGLAGVPAEDFTYETTPGDLIDSKYIF